jgi:D-alanine-D-alanine ligase
MLSNKKVARGFLEEDSSGSHIFIQDWFMKIKIALLLGGMSREREVSLNTGEQIYQALNKNKYEVFKYDPQFELRDFFEEALNGKFDLVFPALHGPYGEDGRLQGLLDLIGVPYLFSGCSSSALAMDKNKTKIIAEDFGIEVIEGLKIKKEEQGKARDFLRKNKKGIVVKPDQLGSSVGISIVRSEKELGRALEMAFSCCEEVLLESFVRGRELTVTILGNKKPEALPVIEIIPKKAEWFDYNSKYLAGATKEICPAEIPESVKKKVQQKAIDAFEVLGCKDLARVDFIWSKDDKIYFLEINTIPGMTSTSLVPQSAKAFGLDFGDFLDKIIEERLNLGLEKN